MYVGTRRDAEEGALFISEELAQRAQPYHAGMSDELRSEALTDFIQGDLPVVVATSAFGMGIDKPDVRTVLHYTYPGSVAEYYQQAGRAGRDGATARCILLYDSDDRKLHEYLINQGLPRVGEVINIFSALTEMVDQNASWVSEEQIATHAKTTRRKARLVLDYFIHSGMAVAEEYQGSRVQLRMVAECLPNECLERASADLDRLRQRKFHMLDSIIRYCESVTCRRQYILSYFEQSDYDRTGWCCAVCDGQVRHSSQSAGSAPAEGYI